MSTEWPILGGEEEEQPYMIVGVPTGDERTIDRVALNRSQYHQITDDKGWREAGTYTEEDGSTAFKAAGLLEDGTLVGHLESHGRTRRTADLRVTPDGRWSSVVESGGEVIESVGRLRAPDEPITSRRTRKRGDQVLWTADAVTTFNFIDDDGTRVARRTTGTVAYIDDRKGEFWTNKFGPHSSISGGTWKPVTGLGPGKSGVETSVPLPGGYESERVITDIATGAKTSYTSRQEVKVVSGQKVYTSAKSETFVAGNGVPSTWASVEEFWEGSEGDHWTQTTTHIDGTQTVERGTYVRDQTGWSASTSTVHPDGAVTVTTTTIDRATNTGQQHTVTTRANGEIAEDTTTQGTGSLRTGTNHRPGDLGPVFVPNPDSQKEGDGSEGKKDGDGDGDKDGDGKDDGERAGDEGGGSGDEETATSDDGSGDDDTGGYPGLGWDGGDSGPFALLPGLAAAAVSRFDDPNQPLDSLGDESALTALLSAALAEAAQRGGTGDATLGSDTGDPLHGVSEATLAAAVRAAKTIDPEWGDWSNPKAHGKFVDSVATDLGKAVLEATALDVATALDKFR